VELRKHNSEAMEGQRGHQSLNADLKQAGQDFADTTTRMMRPSRPWALLPPRQDIEAKENEIRTAKYTEVETLMLKDTAAKPDASVLWAQLGQAHSA